ncbi:MAG: hypothetical protein JSR60_08520 [Proteobacteria bacterium]|nr:hypothetical protein [Pseudomonadota bacterium]
MRWLLLAIGAPLSLAALGLLTWAFVLYQDDLDAKNMRYVAWKHGLASINLDRAVGTLEEDPEGKRDLIISRTPSQLIKRFGFLLTPHQAGPVLERCARDSWAGGKTAFYLRHSQMIVVFETGVATQTGLLKPC